MMYEWQDWSNLLSLGDFLADGQWERGGQGRVSLQEEGHI